MGTFTFNKTLWEERVCDFVEDFSGDIEDLLSHATWDELAKKHKVKKGRIKLTGMRILQLQRDAQMQKRIADSLRDGNTPERKVQKYLNLVGHFKTPNFKREVQKMQDLDLSDTESCDSEKAQSEEPSSDGSTTYETKSDRRTMFDKKIWTERVLEFAKVYKNDLNDLLQQNIWNELAHNYKVNARFVEDIGKEVMNLQWEGNMRDRIAVCLMTAGHTEWDVQAYLQEIGRCDNQHRSPEQKRNSTQKEKSGNDRNSCGEDSDDVPSEPSSEKSSRLTHVTFEVNSTDRLHFSKQRRGNTGQVSEGESSDQVEDQSVSDVSENSSLADTHGRKTNVPKRDVDSEVSFSEDNNDEYGYSSKSENNSTDHSLKRKCRNQIISDYDSDSDLLSFGDDDQECNDEPVVDKNLQHSLFGGNCDRSTERSSDCDISEILSFGDTSREFETASDGSNSDWSANHGEHTGKDNIFDGTQREVTPLPSSESCFEFGNSDREDQSCSNKNLTESECSEKDDTVPRKSRRHRQRPRKFFTPSNFVYGFCKGRDKFGSPTWCICEGPEEGPMVRCSNWKFGIKRKQDPCRKWYHYEVKTCVNYAGESIWICPICTRNGKTNSTTKCRTSTGRTDTNYDRGRSRQSSNSENSNPDKRASKNDSEISLSSSGSRHGDSAGSSDDGSYRSCKSQAEEPDIGIESDKSSNKSDKSEEPTDDSECSEGFTGEDFCEMHGFDKEILDYVPPTTFELKFPAKNFSNIYDYQTRKFIGREWAGLVSEKLTEVQLTCSFSARRDPYYGKKVFATMNGYCGCGMQFVVAITKKPMAGEDVCAEVNAHGLFKLEQEFKVGRQLRKAYRRKVKEILANESSRAVYVESFAHATAFRLLHKNNEYQSKGVLKTCAYEARQATRKDNKDMLNDLKILCEELRNHPELSPMSKLKGFVQAVSSIPYRIDMYTLKQLQIVSKWAEKVGIYLYLDATGGVCRKLENAMRGKGSVYYYALVARTIGLDGEQLSLVIAEFFSNANDQANIEGFLLNVTRQLRAIKKLRRLCEAITVDFSYALLHSVVHVFNNETLTNYITRSWNLLQNGGKMPLDKSFVCICIAHLLHALSTHLKKKGIPDLQRKVAMAFFVKIHEASTSEEYHKAVRDIIVLFGNPLIPTLISDELKGVYKQHPAERYEKLCKDMESLLRTEDELDLLVPDNPATTAQREMSPFYQDFRNKRQSLSNNKWDLSSGSLCRNPMHCEEVLNVIQGTYIAMAPFYVRAIITSTRSRHRDFKRSTNAQVESYFRDLKHVYHKKRNLHGGDFVRSHVKFILGLINEATQKSMQASWKRGTKYQDDSEDSDRSKKSANPKKKKKREDKVPDPTNRKSDDEIPNVVPESKQNQKRGNRAGKDEAHNAEEKWSKSKRGRDPYYATRYKNGTEGNSSSKRRGSTETVDISDGEYVESNELPPIHREVLFRVGDVTGRLKCLQSALGHEWLDDNVINAYAKYLQTDEHVDPEDICILDTHTFSRKTYKQQLESRKVYEARRLENHNATANEEAIPNAVHEFYYHENLLIQHTPNAITQIVLPFNCLDHWFVIAVTPSTHEIIIYNSLPTHKRLLASIKTALTFHLNKLFRENSEYSVEVAAVQRQLDGHDCGVHTLLRIQAILKGQPLRRFSLEEVLDARQTIVNALLLTTDAGHELLQTFLGRLHELQHL